MKATDPYEDSADGLQELLFVAGVDESLVALIKRLEGPV
jgi:hypothetical protein